MVWFGLILELDNVIIKFTWTINFEKSLGKALGKKNNERLGLPGIKHNIKLL